MKAITIMMILKRMKNDRMILTYSGITIIILINLILYNYEREKLKKILLRELVAGEN